MKLNNSLYKTFTTILFLYLLTSCSKNITENELEAFEPISIESQGGSWNTVAFDNTSIIIAAPSALNSTEYQSELTSIIEQQKNISEDNKNKIKKWASSGIIIWNNIARNFVSKYNLAPEANADDTYPVPSAANAGDIPKFPFANPPYSSRAYAYLQTAIYDALITCWKYKFAYNRKSPATNDTRIQSLENIQSTLPSYPSEDAVVATVAQKLLSILFPNDSTYFITTATEQKNAKILSGAASPSDILAGENIAQEIATKAIARMKSDKMGASVGNDSSWKILYAEAQTRGTNQPWKSLETPARPPMLPFFGNISLWSMTQQQKIDYRPSTPPAIGSDSFNKDMEEVKYYANNPNEKFNIAYFWADGISTSTPPGHWNYIACHTITQNKLSELKTAKVLCYLNIVLCDAAICCWDTKSYYYYPRPTQIDPSIKTIGLPNFPSYPSGHSTFSGAAATMLSYFFPQDQSRLQNFATEASNSRIYGAIHFKFDCTAGLILGNKIANNAIIKAQTDTN